MFRGWGFIVYASPPNQTSGYRGGRGRGRGLGRRWERGAEGTGERGVADRAEEVVERDGGVVDEATERGRTRE